MLQTEHLRDGLKKIRYGLRFFVRPLSHGSGPLVGRWGLTKALLYR